MRRAHRYVKLIPIDSFDLTSRVVIAGAILWGQYTGHQTLQVLPRCSSIRLSCTQTEASRTLSTQGQKRSQDCCHQTVCGLCSHCYSQHSHLAEPGARYGKRYFNHFHASTIHWDLLSLSHRFHCYKTKSPKMGLPFYPLTLSCSPLFPKSLPLKS